MLAPQVLVDLLPELGIGGGFREMGPLADLECLSELSSSVAIAFEWGGLAPWRQRLLRVVVRVTWPWCLIRCDPEP